MQEHDGILPAGQPSAKQLKEFRSATKEARRYINWRKSGSRSRGVATSSAAWCGGPALGAVPLTGAFLPRSYWRQYHLFLAVCVLAAVLVTMARTLHQASLTGGSVSLAAVSVFTPGNLWRYHTENEDAAIAREALHASAALCRPAWCQLGG